MKNIFLLLILSISFLCINFNLGEAEEINADNYEYIVEIVDSINKQDGLLKYLGYNRNKINQNDSMDEKAFTIIKDDSIYNKMYKQIGEERQNLYNYWMKCFLFGGGSALAVFVGVAICLFLSSVMN